MSDEANKSEVPIGREYETMRASVSAGDRSEHVAATVEHLHSLPSLDGVMVEDDGVRALVHIGQERGIAASAWLAEHEAKP